MSGDWEYAVAHPRLRITAAYYALGAATTTQLVDAAHAALEDGVYSLSLGELATTRDPTWADCSPLFVAAARELEVPIPDDPATAVLAFLDYYLPRLAEGVFTAEQALAEFYSIQSAVFHGPAAKIAQEVVAPLQPFLGLHYSVEDHQEYDAYRATMGLAPLGTQAVADLYTETVAVAKRMCLDRWGATPDPAWHTSAVLGLTRQIDESRNFSHLPILADALQDAGCENVGLLAHCRDPHAIHVNYCLVVDILLGKA
jgi:hypothetical protein